MSRADVSRAVADGKCPLPLRCPSRGYCTMFHEGSFKAPCWDETDTPDKRVDERRPEQAP